MHRCPLRRFSMVVAFLITNGVYDIPIFVVFDERKGLLRLRHMRWHGRSRRQYVRWYLRHHIQGVRCALILTKAGVTL